MTKLEYNATFIRIYYDIMFGLHSGIPACCILAFVCDHKRYPDPRHAGYVRCAACIAVDKVVPVHQCNSTCTEFLESLGIQTVGMARAMKRKGTDAGVPVSSQVVAWLFQHVYNDLLDSKRIKGGI